MDLIMFTHQYHPRPYQATCWGHPCKTVIPTYDNRPMGHHNVNAMIHHNLPTDAYGMVSEVYAHLPMLEKIYVELKLLREVSYNFNAIQSCFANSVAIQNVAKNLNTLKELNSNTSGLLGTQEALQALQRDISSLQEQIQTVLDTMNNQNNPNP